MLTKENAKCILSIAGLVIAAYVGASIPIGLVNSLIIFLGTGTFVNFPLKASFLATGVFYGAGVYLQCLKEFKIWPMENRTPNFRPRAIWDDLKLTLKRFDWELLKMASHVWAGYAKPTVKKTQDGNATANSWYFRDLFSNLLNTAQEEYVIPYSFRASLIVTIHNARYSLEHYQELMHMNDAQVNDVYLQESAQYLARHPRDMLNGQGLIESISKTLYNEFNDSALGRRLTA